MMRSWYVFLALVVITSAPMLAQRELADPLRPAAAGPRIYIGPVGGYNRSLHSSGFQSVAGDVLCPDFESGNANGYYFGFSGEYLLGKPKDSKSSIIARIVFNSLPASYTVPGDKLPSIDEANQIVYSTVQHVASVKYETVDLELIYKLNLFNTNFGIVVGPTVGIPINAKIEQRMELVEPLNATFQPGLGGEGAVYLNGGRAILTRPESDIEDRSGIRIAVKAGVQYEIPIGRLVLVPCMYYNFGITEVSPANNLRINALQAGVDLRFAI